MAGAQRFHTLSKLRQLPSGKAAQLFLVAIALSLCDAQPHLALFGKGVGNVVIKAEKVV